MSEREIRAAIRSICADLDLRIRGCSIYSVVLGAGLATAVACEGNTESRSAPPDGGAGGMDAGATAGSGPVDAGGTDPGPVDAYGITAPPGGSGGIGGMGGAGGAAGD